MYFHTKDPGRDPSEYDRINDEHQQTWQAFLSYLTNYGGVKSQRFDIPAPTIGPRSSAALRAFPTDRCERRRRHRRSEPRSHGLREVAEGRRVHGGGKLETQEGTRVVLTLKDDAGSPATITSVVAISQFADGCLIVGHSTVTDKAYLYRLNATLDTWTDSGGVTHTTRA
jgi:hypothetical protein